MLDLFSDSQHTGPAVQSLIKNGKYLDTDYPAHMSYAEETVQLNLVN